MSMMVGESYAFFRYERDIDEIERNLPAIKILNHLPQALELKVQAGLVAEQAIDLDYFLHEARREGMDHTMRARYPGQDNKVTAIALSEIVNGMYSMLYSPGETFIAGIIYKEGSRYVDLLER
jgi:hypothetical protein